jgi:hypothetical protein
LLSKASKKRQEKARKRPGTKTIYMDATDFWHEVGQAPGGSKVYRSVDEVLKLNHCAVECGVVRAELKYVKNILPAEHNRGLSESDWETYESSPAFVAHLEERLEKINKLAKLCEEQIGYLHSRGIFSSPPPSKGDVDNA